MSITDASGIPDHPRTLAEKVWDGPSGRQGRERRARPHLHRPAPGARGHEPAGVRRPARRRAPAAASRPHDRDRGPQHSDARHRQADRRPDQPHADRDAAPQRRGVRRAPALARRQGAGHRPRRRPAAGSDDAGHHRRLRRLAHLHPRRVRRDGLRHRHERGRARHGDPDAAAQALQDDGDHRRGRAQARRHREGHHPRRDREDRHRRRAGLRARVPRQRDPRPLHGGAHDDLQHVDRGRRPRRAWSPPTRRRSRTSKDAPHAPKGQDWEDAVAYWRTLPTDEGAVYDAEVYLDANELEPFVTWGTNPGQGVSLSDVVPSPDDYRRPQRPRRRRARAGVHGADARNAAEGCRRSTPSSWARAPTAASKTCAPSRRSSRVARRPTAFASWSCRAPRACASRPRPRASTRSSPSSAPSGASPAARCAWA